MTIEVEKQDSSKIKNASIEQTEAVQLISLKTQIISHERDNILMSSVELGALAEELKRISNSLREIVES